MPEVRITAWPRTEFGKGPARRTRGSGRVPAVIYGHGLATRHVSLPARELQLALRQSNVLLRVDVEGRDELTLPRAVVRDPLRGDLEHLDLVLVRSGEQVSVSVPLELTGTPAPGVLVDVQSTTVPVRAEATHIPGSLEFSIEGLAAGTAVHAGDVVLPDGVTLDTEPDTVLVALLAAQSQAQFEADLGAEPLAPEATGVSDVVAGPEG